ncbi:NAD(P)/FAD-dependent oxidoreductase [uncultured Friedmanniella sp.]|uniref:NAD(P)/FAD-dependent oxidoreductase n=1 Tax=uncultured Friedmanniella sp. TaxID=335381 RepID=UPI0035CB0277
MTPASQRVLVVGAGMAGLRTAETLRGAGFAGEVLVVGEEPWAPYNRPPLSKQVLRDGSGHPALAFRPRAGAADVVWRLGTRVRHADLAARVATLADGRTLGFDALVAASGVRARRLDVPGPGVGVRGRHVVRTLEDAVALREELRPGARVVVIGAGFVGCEVAVAARHLGCTVACVALDPLPMLRPLGAVLAAELRRRHERIGITFHLGATVAALTGDHRVDGVALGDGTVLAADVVVEAVGSQPTTDWLGGQGLDLGDGVLTDAGLHPVTAGGRGLAQPLRHVVAAGDLARFPNPRFSAGAHRVEHWSAAADTARRAGTVLAAGLASGFVPGPVEEVTWEALPSFWSDQGDLRLQSYGMPGLADPGQTRLLHGSLDTECVLGYFDQGELLGVVGLGRGTAAVLAGYRAQVGRGLVGGSLSTGSSSPGGTWA